MSTGFQEDALFPCSQEDGFYKSPEVKDFKSSSGKKPCSSFSAVDLLKLTGRIN